MAETSTTYRPRWWVIFTRDGRDYCREEYVPSGAFILGLNAKLAAEGKTDSLRPVHPDTLAGAEQWARDMLRRYPEPDGFRVERW
jgi:hypothetical protein